MKKLQITPQENIISLDELKSLLLFPNNNGDIICVMIDELKDVYFLVRHSSHLVLTKITKRYWFDSFTENFLGEKLESWTKAGNFFYVFDTLEELMQVAKENSWKL